MANGKYGSILINCAEPIELLRRTRWNIPGSESGAISQEQIARWNQELDERSCLGRLAKAAVLIGQNFPDSSIMAANVMEDFLRNIMLEMIGKENHPPLSMLEEILLYEEPHAVIQVDGAQFDPISKFMLADIVHPKVELHPIWEHITCSLLVSKSNLTENPLEKMNILDQADEICPDTTLVMENKIFPLMLLGKSDEAIRLMLKVVKRRPTARALFVISELTGDAQYRQRLMREYPSGIIEILLEEVSHGK
jgi:hypothetical protein